MLVRRRGGYNERGDLTGEKWRPAAAHSKGEGNLKIDLRESRCWHGADGRWNSEDDAGSRR